jgi:hypothetical protein
MPPHHAAAPAIRWDGPQPAPKALWKLVHANFPQTRNDGIYNDRNIAGTRTKSLHAEGRALDIGLSVTDPNEKLIGDQLFAAFIENAGVAGFQELIWNRKIWSSTNPTLHHYTGHDPHTGHIHAGFTRAASQQSVMPGSLVVAIGIIQTGIKELAQANRNFA